MRYEATTPGALDITAATLTDPLRAMAARGEQLRLALAELDRIHAEVCHMLRYAGERDGKVPAPMLRRMLLGGAA